MCYSETCKNEKFGNFRLLQGLKVNDFVFRGSKFSIIQQNLSVKKGQIIFVNKQTHLILQAVHGIGYVLF